MADAISIFAGAFGFFSALGVVDTPVSGFPSLPVVSAVGVDEIGVAAFLIGPVTLVDALATAVCNVVAVFVGIAGLWSFVVFGSSVEVIFAFMM